MSALSAMNYLFLNRNISAVPAGEPFLNCMIIHIFATPMQIRCKGTQFY